MFPYIKTVSLVLCFSIFFGLGISNAAEEELLVMTEQFPPFNYQENDKIEGLSTLIVKKLLEGAHLKYKIELVPWERAYNTALYRPNTLIYTIAKTESRKGKFHWIGKISNRKVSLFRLRSRQDLASITLGAAKENARIASVQGDAATEKIIAMGFATKNITMIRDVTTSNLCIKHVMNGRSDYFPMNPSSLKHRIKAGDVPDLFTEQFVIHDADGYYIAANIETDADILEALRGSYKRLAEEGFINKVINEYLKF
jgi:polar amino acid transport system substrate-binding protein